VINTHQTEVRIKYKSPRVNVRDYRGKPKKGENPQVKGGLGEVVSKPSVASPPRLNYARQSVLCSDRAPSIVQTGIVYNELLANKITNYCLQKYAARTHSLSTPPLRQFQPCVSTITEMRQSKRIRRRGAPPRWLVFGVISTVRSLRTE
jgi:hypothetical protein